MRGSAAPVADPTTAPQPRIAKVSERQRYELHLGEQLVSIVDYRENDTSVALTRTFTIPPQRGKSYAADLVAFAVDDVERQLSKQVVPVCWYVAEWLEAHPERERTGTADATGTA